MNNYLGPWTVDADLAMGNRVISDDDNGVVAEVLSTDDDDKLHGGRRDANAQLIAAAPELEAVLRAVLVRNRERGLSDAWPEYDAARALLARLDGAR